MKLLKIGLVVLALGLLVAPAMAQDSKVGFVNPQRIVSESRIGQIAQEDLARLGKEKDRRVREALRDVEDIRQQLESGTLSVTEEQGLEKSLRLAVRSYEQLVEQSNLDIQVEERRLIQFVMRRADSILRRIAEERGFTMILTDPEIIGYVHSSMDITDRVITELNGML
ncbi:OmpH family outer membrane protein [Pseudodesulfovibrio sp. zrk46]|uniref:OmpH family outer membrane protein n=1 Tax=Pseudodesulfovibrio sp. zrk46 TaxID=2725288 RepID=UPI00144A1BEE|nr:OmpH family outer membrane protein [Pseudodesulfovibrio sp. zrk46]QJB54920.1 OmpH family outer membrane protein [Pseudodesulfovibrio sp. zrk46]